MTPNDNHQNEGQEKYGFVCDCMCMCMWMWMCVRAYWLWVFGELMLESFIRTFIICLLLCVPLVPSSPFSPSRSLCFIISFYFIFILWLIFISIQINPHSLSCLLCSLSFSSQSNSVSPSPSLYPVLIHFFIRYHILLYTKLFFFLTSSLCPRLRSRRRCRHCCCFLVWHFIRHWKHFMKYDPTIMTKTNHFENGQLSLYIQRERDREWEQKRATRLNVELDVMWWS